jgi:uncharacterized iron-regulated membrane protein
MAAEAAATARPRARPAPALGAVHRRLGLVVALVVLATAVSGVGLAYRETVWRWQHPALAGSPEAAAPAALAAAASRAAGRFVPGEALLLDAPRAGRNGWLVHLPDDGLALVSAEGDRLLARWSESRSPFGVLLDLHVHLLAGETGRTVAGAFAIVTLLAVALGRILFARGVPRVRLRELFPQRMTRGRWMLAHRQWGALATAPIAVVVTCGLLLAWHWAWRPGLPAPETLAEPTITAAATADVATLTAVLEAAARTWPDARVRFLDLRGLPDGRVTLRLRRDGEAHPNGRSSLVVDASGRLLSRYDATEGGFLTFLDDWAYPLHAGKLDVPGVHTLVVLTGLVLATVAASGVGTWARRRAGRAPRRATARRHASRPPLDSGKIRRRTAGGEPR